MPNPHTTINEAPDTNHAAKLQALIRDSEKGEHPSAINERILLELCHTSLAESHPNVTTMEMQAIWFGLYWQDRGRMFWQTFQDYSEPFNDTSSLDRSMLFEGATHTVKVVYEDKTKLGMLVGKWQYFLLAQRSAAEALKAPQPDCPMKRRSPRLQKATALTTPSSYPADILTQLAESEHDQQAFVHQRKVNKQMLAQRLYSALSAHHPESTQFTLMSAISTALVYGTCDVTADTFQKTWEALLKRNNPIDACLSVTLLSTLARHANVIFANHSAHPALFEAHEQWLLQPAYNHHRFLKQQHRQTLHQSPMADTHCTHRQAPTPRKRRHAESPPKAKKTRLTRKNAAIHPKS